MGVLIKERSIKNMRLKPKYKNMILLVLMILLSIIVIIDYIKIIFSMYQFTLFGLITNILMIAFIFKIYNYLKKEIIKKELKRKFSHQAK